jgi:hypothetical protein
MGTIKLPSYIPQQISRGPGAEARPDIGASSALGQAQMNFVNTLFGIGEYAVKLYAESEAQRKAQAKSQAQVQYNNERTNNILGIEKNPVSTQDSRYKDIPEQDRALPNAYMYSKNRADYLFKIMDNLEDDDVKKEFMQWADERWATEKESIGLWDVGKQKEIGFTFFQNAIKDAEEKGDIGQVDDLITNARGGGFINDAQASQYADLARKDITKRNALLKAQSMGEGEPEKTPIYITPSISNPKGMIEQGNINLNNRPRVKNPDGSISTVRSISIEEDGKEILIPTVSNSGKIMTDEEAITEYKKTGENLGIFDSSENATNYARKLHIDQSRQQPRKIGGWEWLNESSNLRYTGADGTIKEMPLADREDLANKFRDNLTFMEQQAQVQNGKLNLAMSDAFVARLQKKGDPSAWISLDMINAASWSGKQGGDEQQRWIGLYHTYFMGGPGPDKSDPEVYSQGYSVVFDPTRSVEDKQKWIDSHVGKGLIPDDAFKLRQKIDFYNESPETKFAYNAIADAYDVSMKNPNKSTAQVKALEYEKFKSLQQFEEIVKKYPNNPAIWNEEVRRILEEKTVTNLTEIVKQVAQGEINKYATGEYRPAYKEATALEYLREQGKAPVGAITEQVLSKISALEKDVLNKSGRKDLLNYTAKLKDSTVIYSDKPIVRGRTGKIVASPNLYQVRYQIIDGAYVPTIYRQNPSTGAFDIIVWVYK